MTVRCPSTVYSDRKRLRNAPKLAFAPKLPPQKTSARYRVGGAIRSVSGMRATGTFLALARRRMP